MFTQLLFLFILLFIIVWYIRRNTIREDFLESQYGDEYQNIIKTFFRGVNYQRNLHLDLYPNEQIKNIKLPYLFPDFVIIKPYPKNYLSLEANTPNTINMIQNDILTNLSTINSQQSIQKYYNQFIGNDIEKNLTSICNSNFVSYTLITLSKYNFDRYSSIFGRKIGVFGSQAIWSLFFIYQIFGKSFDLSNITLYHNENEIKNDYLKETITFIFLVTSHPSKLCNDILSISQSTIIDIDSDPEITLEKIHFFISESASIKQIELSDYNLGNITVNTIIVHSIFTTHKDSDKTLVYLFTKYFSSNIPYYKNYIRSMTNLYQWSLIPMAFNLDIHPGSKQFFTETGLIMVSDETNSNKINYLINSKYGNSTYFQKDGT